MKKKKIVHPKLYIDIVEKRKYLLYKQNEFNNNGGRVISKELNKNFNIDNDICYLNEINKEQLEVLNKYLNIQKRVLQKHEKGGNYETSKVVENSITTMLIFKQEFNEWFEKNN